MNEKSTGFSTDVENLLIIVIEPGREGDGILTREGSDFKKIVLNFKNQNLSRISSQNGQQQLGQEDEKGQEARAF